MDLSSTNFEVRNSAIIPDCIGITQCRNEINYSFISNTSSVIIDEINKLYDGKKSFLDYKIKDLSNSHEKKICYYDFEFISGKPIYFFFNIICNKKIDVSMIISSCRYIRVWINNRILTITGKENETIIFFSLEKGKNIICLEQLDAQAHHEIGIRIAPLISEKSFCSLINNAGYKERTVAIYYEVSQSDSNYTVSYMYVPVNCININNDSYIYSITKIGDKLLQKEELKLFEGSSIEISQKEVLKENITSCITFDFSNRDINYAIFSDQYSIYIGNIKNVMILLYEKIKSINKSYALEYEDKQLLYYYFQELRKYNSFEVNATYFIKELDEHIERIKRGEKNDIYSEGFHRIVFQSKLDQNLFSYNVRIPKYYNPQKSYPLFIIFQIFSIENRCFDYADISGLNNTIVAEISGRGITLGSYIGDATINEIYDDIFQRYNIDERKVFSTGHSNGSYATWIQAELTPHKYAGIYPSSSAGNPNMLCNLSNTVIYSLTSDMDSSYIYSKSNGNISLNSLNKFHEICADKYTHTHLPYINRNKLVIGDLIKHTNEMYPKEIHFVTERNRYLQSFWITIHSIALGARYAQIDANYTQHEIKINTKYAMGITIKIPPTIDKSYFEVKINDKKYQYKNYKNTSLSYYIDNLSNTISEACECTETKNFEIYKGNGILDVYLSPLNIIACDLSNIIMRKIAISFSKPITNGIDSQIDIQYPVYDIDDIIWERFNYQNSLIILDCCSNKFTLGPIKTILSRCRIETTDKGYAYNQKCYNGDYMVMQVIANPYNQDCSILYINTNSEDLYLSNIFTRNVIIPSYFSGYHSYLNNSALIYNGYDYFKIVDWGMEISCIMS